MTALAFALAYVGGCAVAAFLVMKGHPWFAFLVLLMTCSLRFRIT